jgi:hypothetical protein
MGRQAYLQNFRENNPAYLLEKTTWMTEKAMEQQY